MNKKIISILGNRPQFIKAAPLSKELKKKKLNHIIIHTGQHYETKMSDIFFSELNILKPKYFLNVKSKYHGQMTGKMIEKIEKILLIERPELVFVFGDTNSTLAGAIAASKLSIPIAHIEAGLRSFNNQMPEEINRTITDRISEFLFCPTTDAVKNLKKEGIFKNVYNVGDLMYEIYLNMRNFYKKTKITERFENFDSKFILLSIHRQESTNCLKQFMQLVEYTYEFAEKENMKIFFPIHPRLKKWKEKIKKFKNIYILPPLSYVETQQFISHSNFVFTDSGGLQKEAYFHKVLCVTLRKETEWIETIKNGWNRIWTNQNYYPKRKINEYGSGKTSKSILNCLNL